MRSVFFEQNRRPYIRDALYIVGGQHAPVRQYGSFNSVQGRQEVELINEVVSALTWKMAKKMRKASTMSATMYEKAAKVKAIFHAELRVAENLMASVFAVTLLVVRLSFPYCRCCEGVASR